MAVKKSKEYYLAKVIEMSLAEASHIKVTGPADLLPSLAPFRYSDVELFIGVYLNGAQEIIEVRVITKGLLNRTLIHPRELFRPALELNAASMIMVHNHPSGAVEPSREDREATQRMVNAGKILGIEVLDHLILGCPNDFYSFRENNESSILPHGI